MRDNFTTKFVLILIGILGLMKPIQSIGSDTTPNLVEFATFQPFECIYRLHGGIHGSSMKTALASSANAFWALHQHNAKQLSAKLSVAEEYFQNVRIAESLIQTTHFMPDELEHWVNGVLKNTESLSHRWILIHAWIRSSALEKRLTVDALLARRLLLDLYENAPVEIKAARVSSSLWIMWQSTGFEIEVGQFYRLSAYENQFGVAGIAKIGASLHDLEQLKHWYQDLLHLRPRDLFPGFDSPNAMIGLQNSAKLFKLIRTLLDHHLLVQPQVFREFGMAFFEELAPMSDDPFFRYAVEAMLKEIQR